MNLILTDRSKIHGFDVLEIKYQFTSSDLARWHRLNKTQTMQRWQSYLLVALVLLPSTVWLILSSAFYASVWMSVATIVMLIYAFWHFVTVRQTLTDGYSCVEQLTDEARLSTFSKSFAQTKWHRIESFQETQNDFQFWRLDRCSLIPKRALSAAQIQETGRFIEQVRNNPAGDSGPLPGYAEVILGDSPHPIYRYHYTAKDMQQMLQSRFVPYTGQALNRSSNTAGSPKISTRSTRRRLLRIIGFAGLAVAVILVSLSPNRDFSTEIFRQGLICLIPFALLLAWNRIALQLRRSRHVKVPPDEIEMRVSNDGIAFGDRDSIVFYHWADVLEIYVNSHFIGFRTINHLINVLPQRAIGDDQTVDQFLELVSDLKRNCVSDKPTTISATPSDNPYQPPTV